MLIRCSRCNQHFTSATGFNKHLRATMPCLTSLEPYGFHKSWQGVWTQSKSNQPLNLAAAKVHTDPIRSTNNPSQTNLTILAMLPATVQFLVANTALTSQQVRNTLKALGPKVYNDHGTFRRTLTPDGNDVHTRFANVLPKVLAAIPESDDPADHLAFAKALKASVDKYHDHVLWYTHVIEARSA